MGGLIHRKAHVDDDVKLGRDVRIWQFASVIRGARIGDGCNIASCAIVDGATLGEGCLIGHGASVHPGARVGNEVFIGPGSCLCNDLWPRADKTGFDIDMLLNGVSVIIEDGASVGANAVIMPGVVIWKGAMVAAGAVVSRDVPPGMLWTRLGDLVPIRGEPKRMRLLEC